MNPLRASTTCLAGLIGLLLSTAFVAGQKPPAAASATAASTEPGRLQAAIERNDLPAIPVLREAKLELVRVTNSLGNMPLHLAARHNAAVVTALLAHGASFDAPDRAGFAALNTRRHPPPRQRM